MFTKVKISLIKIKDSHRSHDLISSGVSAGVSHHSDADRPREVTDCHLGLLTLRHLKSDNVEK